MPGAIVLSVKKGESFTFPAHAFDGLAPGSEDIIIYNFTGSTSASISVSGGGSFFSASPITITGEDGSGTFSITPLTSASAVGHHYAPLSILGPGGFNANVDLSLIVYGTPSPGDGSLLTPFLVNDEVEMSFVGRGNANPAAYNTWTLDKHYKLASNITLPGTWTPIGGWTNQFTGSLDGAGMTIFNLTINNSSSQNQGLFGVTGSSAVVKDFDLSSVSISGGQYTGAVVGYNIGTIDNCNVLSGNVSGSSSTVGGIAGFSQGVVQNCSFAVNQVISTNMNGIEIGGIVGQLNSSGQVINCRFTGLSVNGFQYVGGVVGRANTGSIQGCSAATSVVGSGGWIGGIIGQHAGTGSITNCNFSGSVSTSGPNVGGVAGEVNTAVIENCYAIGGIIQGTQYVGGVMGNGSALNKCYFSGNVEGTNHVGGVAGTIGNSGVMQNCYATGTVTGTGFAVGGVRGYLTGGYNSIQNCYSTAIVEGSFNVGGVPGSITGGSNIQNCIALNPSIEATSITSGIGRIWGGGSGSAFGNYARDDMIVYTPGSWTSDIAVNGKDGANLAVNNTIALNSIFSAANGWDPVVWSVPTVNFDALSHSPLPTLIGLGTQSPVLP